MSGLTFKPVAEKKVTRDGRQWLKDTQFCEAVKAALKQTYDGKIYLEAVVTGKTELRKLRGALRYFADAQGWGLSLAVAGDDTKPDSTFTVTFRAQAKREVTESAARKVRRRKDETDEAYIARVKELHPRNKGEKEADYAVRLAAFTTAKKPEAAATTTTAAATATK